MWCGRVTGRPAESGSRAAGSRSNCSTVPRRHREAGRAGQVLELDDNDEIKVAHLFADVFYIRHEF
jgi:hypothetical protein